MLATAEIIDEAAQPGRLAEVLPGTLAKAPIYQAWQQKGAIPTGFQRVEDLQHLPFITKEDIRRDFPRNFLGDEVDLESLVEEEVVELENTSGTSEVRTPLLLPFGWWSEQERWALMLNPVVAGVLSKNPAARRISINSPVCSGDICYTGVPSRDERVVGNALHLSLSKYPFLWGETDLARMAAEAVDWDPEFLDVDPVYGVVFALFCERRGIRLPRLRFILGSYEYVSVAHRQILERAFGVPVFNLYGSTETGHLLMEDDEGRMRPSLQTAFLEVLEKDSAGIGNLVVTTLTNPFMPLIRYRIGDLVERFELPYQTGYRVHGRAKDAFVRKDGRRITVWQVDECFSGFSGFAHYQLSERAGDQWLLRFVPDAVAPAERTLWLLRERLLELVKPAGELSIQATDMLAPETSGKFRLCYPALKAS